MFVALEIRSRRLIHLDVTEQPTSEWTLQQLRETLPGDQDCKFLIHNRGDEYQRTKLVPMRC
jgi:hypothetical protein